MQAPTQHSGKHLDCKKEANSQHYDNFFEFLTRATQFQTQGKTSASCKIVTGHVPDKVRTEVPRNFEGGHPCDF